MQFGETGDGDALDEEADWGPDRQIPAAFLLELLTGRPEDPPIHPRGLRIRGARVTGPIDWDWQQLPVPVELFDCVLDSAITLDHAQVAGLSLIRCRLPGLSAEQMTCASTLKLVRSRISGTVNLRDAVISGAVLASGAHLEGAIGLVDWSDQKVALLATRIQASGALVLDDTFEAEGVVLLPGARIGGNLFLSGRFHNPTGNALEAVDAEIAGSVVLAEGFQAHGRMLVDRARISGDFICDGAAFDGHGGESFSGIRLEVGGGLMMRAGFSAVGAVHLFGAQIGGSWGCWGSSFTNPTGGASIWASGARIEGSVYFDSGFTSSGSIRMRGALIRGNLSCGGGTFSNPGQVALRAVNLTVEGDLLFGPLSADGEPLRAEGEVGLVGASIGGLVHCRGASFSNPGGIALTLAEAEIAGNVDLNAGFEAVGEVRLRGARIGGRLDCDQGSFVNPAAAGGDPAAIALNLVGLDVGDSVLLHRGFRAEGQVRLNRARIGGLLECSGGEFHNPGGFALFARAVRVGAGVLFMTGFKAVGSVRLTTGQITGDVNCTGGAFGEGFHLGGTVVSGSFRWREIAAVPSENLDLRRMVVGELDDDLASWPAGGRIWLAGFSYGRLSDRAPRSPVDRIAWIRRQRGYTPEPYQQLAALYRSSGQISEATTVAIAQQDDLLERGDLSRPARAWTWFIGRSLGHGYRPGRAAWALLVLYVLTVASVWLGVRTDAFIQVGNTAPQPAVTASRCTDDYPCLSVPAYALETITPILNLHQGENWHPKSSSAGEWILRDWLYLSTVFGYAGTTLLAAGLSGLARSA